MKDTRRRTTAADITVKTNLAPGQRLNLAPLLLQFFQPQLREEIHRQQARRKRTAA